MDPDYKLPETDIDDNTDTEEMEVDAEELELLVVDAEEPLPDDHSEEMYETASEEMYATASIPS